MYDFHIHYLAYIFQYSILWTGLRGLMLAALLAALMSSLTSILNSASSIMTLDIWHQFRKKASQSELMIVGRVTVLVLIALSILWLPILQQTQGGRFWFYVQSVRSYLIPPLCMMFLLGLFWKRTTEQVLRNDFNCWYTFIVVFYKKKNCTMWCFLKHSMK